MIKRLVPLGSWCRTAYQCRLHATALGLEEAKSGPFDWTITPFRALSRIIRGDFNGDLLLNPIDSYVSRVGSVACGYSGICFHHDLSPEVVSEHGGSKNDPVIHPNLINSWYWDSAKSRFIHSLGNLESVLRSEGNLYVRWMRFGRGRSVDWQFPEVFDGETPLKCLDLLSSSGFYRSSGLLYITSRVVEGVRDPFENPIQSISEVDRNCWECTILERKGHNGDQLPNFKGDDCSWRAVLERVISNLQSKH